jgi:acetoacetate decarboxylase
MKISEQEYESFFSDIKFRNVPLPSTGEVFQMPLIGEKAVQMAAFFTASRPKVLGMLPIPDLVPVQLDGDRTIIGVIGIEYTKRNVPPYNEILVVFPVAVGKAATPPGAQDLLAEGLGGCTLFIRHIAVDTRFAEVLGNELLGYSKFIGDIRFVDGSDQRTCVFSDAGEEILRFSVNSNVGQYGDWERNTMSVSTYKYQRLYRLTYSSQTRHGVDVPPGGSIAFGPHPLGRMLADLEVSPQPVISLYSPYFQLISDEKRLEVLDL